MTSIDNRMNDEATMDIASVSREMSRRQETTDTLQAIPGIGPNLAEHLREIGYHDVSALRDQDTERMYDRLRARYGGQMDRCVLYAFRCAVYYASNDTHDPELLKWWNWKDRT